MKKLTALLIALLLLLALPVGAEEVDTPVEIATPEDLVAIAQNPNGSYILVEDLDMAGITWESMDFAGILDGNGHSILNLTLSAPGQEKPLSYDGNRKSYETAYVGLFATMKNAQVKNLNLVNVRGVVTSDEPCFLAGIAGYAENSTITDCTLSGTLELRAHDRQFGVGGLVGYGSGSVERCIVDVTLICTDTDKTTRDEQFLGGIYATGFMDVKDCTVAIDGYVSEHGYAHNGGIVGMYMEYPFGQGKKGYVTGNQVNGKITFFENNTNRRAYCEALVGEALVNRYVLDNNKKDFKRDERFEYDKELRPEMCENPEYDAMVTPAKCDSFGFTTYICKTCGYTDTDDYRGYEHSVTQWEITKQPTYDADGESTGSCDGCGKVFTRPEAKLELPPTTEPAETEPAATQPSADGPVADPALVIGIVVLVAAAVGVVVVLCMLAGRSKGGKYLKK